MNKEEASQIPQMRWRGQRINQVKMLTGRDSPSPGRPPEQDRAGQGMSVQPSRGKSPREREFCCCVGVISPPRVVELCRQDHRPLIKAEEMLYLSSPPEGGRLTHNAVLIQTEVKFQIKCTQMHRP